MPYSMRFFVDGAESSPALPQIAAALRAVDPAFEIRGRDLYRGLELLGQIAVRPATDATFGSDVRLLQEQIDAVGGDSATLVKDRLARAHSAVAVQLVWGKRGTETTLDLLAPLWQWLFEHHDGLLQTDGEGLYDADKLLLELS